ncbi:MAG: NUDIX domain-containing protein [Bacteroidetes bacterium]|jgi:ADP-ribose pyrophosphatase YjhB (NUDIX family)|nr:NUDIX domain-containing protein [Bacteroidota bacterium]
MLAITHKLNYCPRCGKKTWNRAEEKLYACNSCDFCYFHNVAAAVAMIIEIDEKILFTVRKYEPAKGLLDLPGGFIDYHESVEEGLRREIKEELNIEIVNPVYLTSFPNRYVYNDIQYHTLDMFFYLKMDQLPPITVSDDVSDYVLRYPSEIEPADFGLESIQHIMAYYQKHKV